MADSKTFKYAGEHVDVAWHGRLCIHIGECGRAKGELFVGGQNPGVSLIFRQMMRFTKCCYDARLAH